MGNRRRRAASSRRSSSPALAPKLEYKAGDAPLHHSISEWLASLWPHRFQTRQQLAVALFHMRPGDMVRIGASVDGSQARGPREGAVGLTLRDDYEYEHLFHGCNPRALAEILNHGLLSSEGKEKLVGVYLSNYKYTSVQYPMELWEQNIHNNDWVPVGLPIAPDAPSVRVVLEVDCDKAHRVRPWRGRRNKSGRIVNNQELYHPRHCLVTAVQVICWKAACSAAQLQRPLEMAGVIQRKYARLQRLATELWKDNGLPHELPREAPLVPPAKKKQLKQKTPRGTVLQAKLERALQRKKLKRKLRRQKLKLRSATAAGAAASSSASTPG